MLRQEMTSANFYDMLHQIKVGNYNGFDFSGTHFEKLAVSQIRDLFIAFHFSSPFLLRLNSCTFNENNTNQWEEFTVGIATTFNIKSFTFSGSNLSDTGFKQLVSSLLRNHHVSSVFMDSRLVLSKDVRFLLAKHATATSIILNGLLIKGTVGAPQAFFNKSSSANQENILPIAHRKKNIP